MAMLAMGCQVGTPVMPSRSITRTGALNRTRLSTTQMGLLGMVKTTCGLSIRNPLTAADRTSCACPETSGGA